MVIANWSADWAWGLPLVVLTVLIHISGLVVIGKRAFRASSHALRRPNPNLVDRGDLGFHDVVGHYPARDRGSHLGRRLSRSWCFI